MLSLLHIRSLSLPHYVAYHPALMMIFSSYTHSPVEFGPALSTLIDQVTSLLDL